MTEEMITQLRDLVDEKGRILAGPNTRDLLESAEEMGLVRRTGAFGLRNEGGTRRVFGQDWEFMGEMWDLYRLSGMAAE